jgi:hypothetical protein
VPAPALDLDLTASLDNRVTFTRASGGTRVNEQGLIETVAADTPRFDHDPVTLAPKGLLIEGARTNLVLHSNNFADGVWNKLTGLTVTPASGISPDGTNNASLVSGLLAAAGDRLVQMVAQTTPVTASGSMWFKGTAGSIGKRVSLEVRRNTGTAAQGVVEVLLTNQWQRVTPTMTMLPDNQGLRLVVRSLDAEDVLIFGAQIEAGPFASSYIPTTTSQVTRADDVAGMFGENFTSWFNPNEGTLFAEFSTFDFTAQSNPCPVAVESNGNNRLALGRAGATKQHYLRVLINGESRDSSSPSGAYPDSTAFVRQAVGVSAISSAFYYNGVQAVSTLTAFPAANQLSIGRGIFRTLLFGHIRRITYWDTRLPNETLQALTTPTN